MLFPFACRPLACTSIVAANDAAVRTNEPAGRACSATDVGSLTSSELSDTSGLLRRSSNVVQCGSGRRDHPGGDRSFDERGVGLLQRGAQVVDDRALVALERREADAGVARQERIPDAGRTARQLLDDGVEFASDTDTEVIAQLIASYLPPGATVAPDDFVRAVLKTLDVLKGTYGLAILSPLCPGTVIGARLSELISR